MIGAVRRYAQLLRLVEVGQVAGLASIGVLFAFESLTAASLARGTIFYLATFLLYAAVFSFNSYSGYEADIRNDRLAYVREATRTLFAGTTLAFLAASLVLYSALDGRLALLGGLDFLLWTLYSLPRFGFKHFPLIGTFVSFLTQVLAFQMAFILYSRVTLVSVYTSLYFGLVFAAGHLHHELIDYDADKKARAQTAAVALGPGLALGLFLLVLLVAGLFWLWLGISGAIGAREVIPFLASLLLQIATTAFMASSRGLGRSVFLLNRRLYRIYYALGGAGYAVLKVIPLLLPSR